MQNDTKCNLNTVLLKTHCCYLVGSSVSKSWGIERCTSLIKFQLRNLRNFSYSKKSLVSSSKMTIKNHWYIWRYPQKKQPFFHVKITIVASSITARTIFLKSKLIHTKLLKYVQTFVEDILPHEGEDVVPS